MAATKQAKHLVLDQYGYKWHGQRYQRVTTIKSKKSSGNALVDWAARMVAEKAQQHVQDFREGKIDVVELQVRLMADDLKSAHNDKRDTAAEFGTVFHELLEAVAQGRQDALHVAEKALEGQPPESRERLWPDVEAFLDWQDRFQPVWVLNEFHVGSHKHLYMGTCDAVARFGEERVMIDLKTSKAVYSDYKLQLAAYRYAEFVADSETGEERPLPQVDSTAVLHVRAGKCELLDVPATKADFAAFLACRELYWWDREAPKSFEPWQPSLFASGTEDDDEPTLDDVLNEIGWYEVMAK